MARKKKSEIDAILEQLKISYFDDSRDIDEESTEQAYESEKDAELAAVLEKIFAESDDTYISDYDDTAEDEVIENSIPESTNTPAASIAQEETPDDESILYGEPSEATIIEINNEPEQAEVSIDGIKTEEDRVDDVLKSMLHFDSFESKHATIEDGGDCEDQIETENDPILEDTEESSNVHVEEIEDTRIEASVDEPEIFDDCIDSIITEDIDDIPEEDYEDVAEESLEIEIIPEPEKNDAITEDLAINEDLIEETYDEPIVYSSKNIITDPNDYVDDIMQYSLSGIPFYKPEKDIDFSLFEEASTEEAPSEDTESPVIVDNKDTDNGITDQEISLLMKLGYSAEINASGENEHANRVIFDKSKDYVPEKHKIVHGFSGKEFSSRSQIPTIQKKFKRDRLIILIQAIIVSVLALAAVATDFISAFSHLRYTSLVSACLLSSLLALIVMSKQVYTGVYAIFKFDTNQYSLPSIILIESIACNLILRIILSIDTSSMVSGSYYSVSGYAILYLAISAWGEWLDCYKESGTFDFIARSNNIYVAEKQTSEDFAYNEGKRRHAGTSDNNDGRYIIKQTKFISGFHKKCAEKTSGTKIFLTIGIIPAIATIIGMTIAIVNDSLISGVSGMSFVFFLSAPLLGVASISLIELLSYLRLKKENSVTIGSGAAESISNVRSLVFNDQDVIDIVAYTPINPNKNTENPKKWLNIAARVFEALGGPLSKVEGISRASASNVTHDIAINSIADNGIDIYFDSSMNILIGDRAYMQSHGIKVKTDVNLTGATRGANRAVIYMAFDRVPQIGFIVTGKIKRSFHKIISLLSSSGINIEVKSYEPEINESFFELNIPDFPISTVKSLNYEGIEASDVSDCELVSSDPLNLCRAVIYSKVIANDIQKNKKQCRLQSIIGFALSIALGILLCLPSKIKLIRILQNLSPILFYAVAIAIIIPNIIHIVKVLKRK